MGTTETRAQGQQGCGATSSHQHPVDVGHQHPRAQARGDTGHGDSRARATAGPRPVAGARTGQGGVPVGLGDVVAQLAEVVQALEDEDEGRPAEDDAAEGAALQQPREQRPQALGHPRAPPRHGAGLRGQSGGHSPPGTPSTPEPTRPGARDPTPSSTQGGGSGARGLTRPLGKGHRGPALPLVPDHGRHRPPPHPAPAAALAGTPLAAGAWHTPAHGLTHTHAHVLTHPLHTCACAHVCTCAHRQEHTFTLVHTCLHTAFTHCTHLYTLHMCLHTATCLHAAHVFTHMHTGSHTGTSVPTHARRLTLMHTRAYVLAPCPPPRHHLHEAGLSRRRRHCPRRRRCGVWTLARGARASGAHTHGHRHAPAPAPLQPGPPALISLEHPWPPLGLPALIAAQSPRTLIAPRQPRPWHSPWGHWHTVGHPGVCTGDTGTPPGTPAPPQGCGMATVATCGTFLGDIDLLPGTLVCALGTLAQPWGHQDHPHPPPRELAQPLGTWQAAPRGLAPSLGSWHSPQGHWHSPVDTGKMLGTLGCTLGTLSHSLGTLRFPAGPWHRRWEQGRPRQGPWHPSWGH